MIDPNIKIFTNLKELGSFLKENRELQNIKIEEVSKLLLIKKDILDKFVDFLKGVSFYKTRNDKFLCLSKRSCS